MDIETIAKEPFRYFNEFIGWAKDFPLDEKSVEIIFKVLKKVENDLTQGRYIQAIIESPSVKNNPDRFLGLISKYLPDFNIRWIIGLILGKYDIKALNKIDDNITKLAFIISKAYCEKLSDEMKEEIIKILKSKDDEAIPSVLNNLTYLNKNNDLDDLLLNIDVKHIPLLLNHIAYSDMNLTPFYSLLEKEISSGLKGADTVWHCIYFKDLEIKHITDLCILTLKIYHPFDFQFFEWCIKDKVKKMPDLVDSIISRINELDYFNTRCMWGILTEGNPNKTVEVSKIIIEMDDGSTPTRKKIGMYFYEIKQKLYNFGDKDTCILLYKTLYGWLKDKDYIDVPVFSDIQLKGMDKQQLMGILHNITEQVIGNSSDFQKSEIIATLKKYPNLFKHIYCDIEKLLDEKKYHPLLVYLNKASNKENRNYDWCVEILNKIEYYFTHFPTVKNEKYPNQKDLIKFMVSDVLSGFEGFISQVYIFEKLHKSGLLSICEPEIGSANPDYLINLNGKEVVVEIKNNMMSEDIRLSGFGSDMGKKFGRDMKKAFFQSVPKYDPKYPVVLVFDTSRSMIEEDMVHNVFHGTLSYLVSIEKPQEETVAYRKNDSLASDYTLASYVQAAIIFKPELKKNQIILSGAIIEHKYRDSIFNSADFNTLENAILC